jgi:phosphatidylethanolamine-binding protein (PEBP) family uncharacterized protein
MVKVASAGVILALAAAAVLTLSGCGGDSAAQTQSSVSGEEAKAEKQAQAPKDTSGEQGPGRKAKEGQEGGGQRGAKAKQGPHIVPPKGPQEQAPTPAELESATVADMILEAPALGAPEGPDSTSALPAAYTCDGKGGWPELRWTGVPAGTKELILFALGLEPVDGALSFNWAVAGLDPSSEGIEAAKLPKGAIPGRNGFGKNGYEICPAVGKAETYIFALYALPKALSPKRGFDPAVLREEVLGLSRNVGLMAVSYGRG